MELIFHITTEASWRKALELGAYVGDSLKNEGFIHFSTASQVVDVANFLFRGREDLMLLCVDQVQLEDLVRYENLEGGERLFPHVYGAVLCSFVRRTVGFPCGEDGQFELPMEVVKYVEKGHVAEEMRL
ncbi:DUF952 domain-containing protein [Planctomycetota bacterium]|nr:DUF952 domain-containing protein [Planctomycetota bacterium]